MALPVKTEETTRPRLKKAERRRMILLELKLRPHVRIAELAERFGVSGETVRRDVDELSEAGLINRAHGGVSAKEQGHYPDYDERSGARLEERERIGRRASQLIQPGDTLMIDSGSTTQQLARFISFEEIRCTVVTNSLPVAMTLGQSIAAEVILCPGDYLPSEAAVVGVDTVEYLAAHKVDRCLIGASGLTADGVGEAIRGFASVKRAMLRQSREKHLLIDGEKFGKPGLSNVSALSELTSVVVDRTPDPDLNAALTGAEVEVIVAPPLGE